MKILQIVNPSIPFPAVTIGGTERIVTYLYEELLDLGHEITIMAHSDSKFDSRVNFIPIGRYNENLKNLWKIWSHLFLNKYDVIHNHGRLAYLLPYLWKKAKVVHTFHMGELEEDNLIKFLKLKPTNLTFAPCGEWIQKRYEHVGGNWHFVNNGIPIDKYSYNKATISSDSPLVIVSRIGPGKGIDEAIEISKRANKKLIIAGKVGDYPHEIEWFEKNILPNCNEQIKFIGIVDDQEKNVIFNNSAGVLLPTRDSEAFNTVMIEANACGCPIVSYNKYCFPEFIDEGINGYTGKTKDDLVNIVKYIHQIDRLSCRQNFESSYTSRIMTTKYLHLYRK